MANPGQLTTDFELGLGSGPLLQQCIIVIKDMEDLATGNEVCEPIC